MFNSDWLICVARPWFVISGSEEDEQCKIYFELTDGVVALITCSPFSSSPISMVIFGRFTFEGLSSREHSSSEVFGFGIHFDMSSAFYSLFLLLSWLLLQIFIIMRATTTISIKASIEPAIFSTVEEILSSSSYSLVFIYDGSVTTCFSFSTSSLNPSSFVSTFSSPSLLSSFVSVSYSCSPSFVGSYSPPSVSSLLSSGTS